jgi:hypothetical protein
MMRKCPANSTRGTLDQDRHTMEKYRHGPDSLSMFGRERHYFDGDHHWNYFDTLAGQFVACMLARDKKGGHGHEEA